MFVAGGAPTESRLAPVVLGVARAAPNRRSPSALAKHRQARCARPAEREKAPPDVRPPQHVLAIDMVETAQAMSLRQTNRLVCGDRKHPSAFWYRTVAKRHEHSTVAGRQFGDCLHGIYALLKFQMHPHSGEENQVELPLGTAQHLESGQVVIHPLDRQRSMKTLTFLAKLDGRLYADNFVAAASQRCSIAPRASSDVHDSDWPIRKQVKQVAVDLSKSDALVLRSKNRCTCAVTSDAGGLMCHGWVDLSKRLRRPARERR